MTDILQKCVAIQLEEGKQLPVSQSYTGSPQLSILYYVVLYYVILGKLNWNIRSVSEEALFSHIVSLCVIWEVIIRFINFSVFQFIFEIFD